MIFSGGAALYLWRERVRLRLWPLLALALACALAQGTHPLPDPAVPRGDLRGALALPRAVPGPAGLRSARGPVLRHLPVWLADPAEPARPLARGLGDAAPRPGARPDGDRGRGLVVRDRGAGPAPQGAGPRAAHPQHHRAGGPVTALPPASALCPRGRPPGPAGLRGQRPQHPRGQRLLAPRGLRLRAAGLEPRPHAEAAAQPPGCDRQPGDPRAAAAGAGGGPRRGGDPRLRRFPRPARGSRLRPSPPAPRSRK